jgi:hypothetical protein
MWPLSACCLCSSSSSSGERLGGQRGAMDCDPERLGGGGLGHRAGASPTLLALSSADSDTAPPSLAALIGYMVGSALVGLTDVGWGLLVGFAEHLLCASPGRERGLGGWATQAGCCLWISMAKTGLPDPSCCLEPESTLAVLPFSSLGLLTSRTSSSAPGAVLPVGNPG